MKTNLKRIIACIEVHIENSRLLGYHGLRRGYEESLRMIKDLEASLRALIKDCEDWIKECPLEDVPKFKWEIEVLEEILGEEDV